MNDDKLKSIWKQNSNNKNSTENFSEAEIQNMLRGKTNDIFSKIKRNIKIGMILIFIYTAFSIWTNTSSYWKNMEVIKDIPFINYFQIFDALLDSFFIGLFIYFVISFYKIKNEFVLNLSIKESLSQIHTLLKKSRRLFFYWIIGVSISFLSGYFYGSLWQLKKMENEGNMLVNLLFVKIIIFMFGLIILAGIIALYFFVFNKLYGNYIKKTTRFLEELNNNYL